MGEGVRRLLLDAAPGERRGVVLLDGRPERLLIEREGEPPRARLGERHTGRLRELTADRDRGYVALADGPDGVAAFAPSAAPPLGSALAVEVVAEAYADKGPRLRVLGVGEGAPRRLSAAPPLEGRLATLAPAAAVETGSAAREAADLAQEAALAITFPLGRGLTLHVEPTRALTAVDVDLAEGARGRRADEQNLRAIRHAVRLLRLKALGGVAVIDLAGAPKGPRWLAEAQAALAPDGEGALALAPDRLGLLRLSRPRNVAPLAEALADADGRASARTLAQAVLRGALREADAMPGRRLTIRCAPEVARSLAPWLAQAGPRFTLSTEAVRPGLAFEVIAL